jgi:hypothetical protein
MGYIGKRDIIIVRYRDARYFGLFNGDFSHDEVLYHRKENCVSRSLQGHAITGPGHNPPGIVLPVCFVPHLVMF